MTDQETRVLIDKCFGQLIDALYLPGVHNYEAVQRASDLIHQALSGENDD